MANIRVLDDLLANKIAAGEVVEKCASVVKELVENSIDAGSDEIKIDLIDAGTKLIRVTDNGKGMDKSDATICFLRHATSKLKTEEDLYRIDTLGFRGEALPSIASVSDVVLKTSTGDIGTIVHISGGKTISVQNGDSRKGTIMGVSNLFYNTPARLKHLKSLYAELANITDYVNKIALSFPNIKFTLTNNDNIVISTDGRGDLLKTIRDIYGLEVAKGMIEIKISDDDYDVTGYISKPELHRSSRNNMITLVNGRVVRNNEINKVINDAYHGYKPDNRYPIVVINIEVDPSLIDVNIHPTKMDIKFSKLEELKVLIENVIKSKLNKKILIPKVEVKTPIYEEQKLELSRIGEAKPSYENELFEEIPLEINEDLEEVTLDLEEKETDRLPELYPVGLVHGTYIVCQNELGMYLIDQHAAKERVNYEYYKEKFGNPIKEKTAMLIPVTVELTGSDNVIFKENIAFMNSLGFKVEEFGINSYIIKEHPTWLLKGYEEEAIKKIIDLIVHFEKDFTIEKFNEAMATMLSCKLSIKANQNITLEEMENLINDLRKCKNPFNCPHGRPTLIFYSNSELEKLFKRSGF